MQEPARDARRARRARRCTAGARSAGSRGWCRRSTSTSGRGEPWLLDLARKLRAQGVDFEALYRDRRRHRADAAPRPLEVDQARRQHGHGHQGRRAELAPRPARRRPRVRHADDRDARSVPRPGHGHVHAATSASPGRNPLQGTELCAVVEFMYSLEHLFSVFGDRAFADRLERVAFNALPATFAPDMWSHQYDQQVNQVQCTINPDHGWTTNGPESNLYGLEPNFGCCTSNMHQGWPKFAAHLWMRTPDEGLVAAAWAPCRGELDARGVPVTVTRRHRLSRSARRSPSRSTPSAPSRFPLRAARARVGRGRDGAGRRAARSSRMKPGTLHRIEREWSGRDDDRRCASRCGRRSRRATTRPSRSSAGRSSTRCDRRGVDARQRRQAAPRAAARRLRGAADARRGTTASCVDDRAAREQRALRGAAGRRAAVLARRRGRRGASEGAAAPKLEARARLGRRDLARRCRLGRPPSREPLEPVEEVR